MTFAVVIYINCDASYYFQGVLGDKADRATDVSITIFVLIAMQECTKRHEVSILIRFVLIT